MVFSDVVAEPRRPLRSDPHGHRGRVDNSQRESYRHHPQSAAGQLGRLLLLPHPQQPEPSVSGQGLLPQYCSALLYMVAIVGGGHLLCLHRLDAESRKLRALLSRGGPGLSAFERSEDATKGPQGALMHVVSMTTCLTCLELWQRVRAIKIRYSRNG